MGGECGGEGQFGGIWREGEGLMAQGGIKHKWTDGRCLGLSRASYGLI